MTEYPQHGIVLICTKRKLLLGYQKYFGYITDRVAFIKFNDADIEYYYNENIIWNFIDEDKIKNVS